MPTRPAAAARGAPGDARRRLCRLRFSWLVSTAVSRRVLWLLPVGMSAVVFAPIIRSHFFSDDFFNLWR
jgi:hypothetical protein